MSANAQKTLSLPPTILFLLGLLAFCLAGAMPLGAQAGRGTISGKVTGPSGAISGAKVTIQNTATGATSTVMAGADGAYRAAGLAAGRYRITASAAGFNARTETATLAAGAARTVDLALVPALSLGSLGFPAAETRGSAQEQALLNKRSHMLQIHQKLGLITAIPMAAALITSLRAGRRSTGAGRDLHMALGSATAGLYFATAYYAIFAPKVPGTQAHGPIRLHRALAWIHGPGMILTPILGAMADEQLNRGERVHGIAKYHGTVAIVTAAAYGLALLSVTKPGWIPGLGHDVAEVIPGRHSAQRRAAARERAAAVAAGGTDWMQETAQEGSQP